MVAARNRLNRAARVSERSYPQNTNDVVFLAAGKPIPMPQLAIAGSSIDAIGSGVSACW